jgi:hypothetical protein
MNDFLLHIPFCDFNLLTLHILSKQVDLAVELLEDLLGIIQVCAHC